MKLESKRDKEPLAIVGIGCRFPGGANSPEQLWNLMANRIDAITDVPEDRWDWDVFFDPDPAKYGTIKSRQGGFVKNIRQFDADFFGYFGEEPSQIDPQQRMLLEVAYEAMEDAGEDINKLRGSNTAVFVSGFLYDHLCTVTSINERNTIPTYGAMGVALCSLSNRISYCYDLKGPSITVDTACSGSLVAIHMACQSIWSGQAEQAIAGGVNALLRPESSILMSKAGFLSPDARCKAYDASANGYVRSEGCGLIFLKPLSKALTDNDEIYGVVRGSATNQDGYVASGFTVPSKDAQIRMLQMAYADANIDPSMVNYVEAHGPGTPVGDPIETGALGHVVGYGRSENDKYLVGSIKTNIGHLEGASGVAGFVKAAISMKKGMVPPNLHFNTPNPNINFDEYRIHVPTDMTPMKAKEEHVIVGVNSFGAGGSNAHIVLEGVKTQPKSLDYPVPNGWHLFAISARTLSSLKNLALAYKEKLANEECESLAEISAAQLTRRTRHHHQLYVIAKNKEVVREALDVFLHDGKREDMFYLQQDYIPKRKVAFAYSGQGGQWPQMGMKLMKSEPVFRAAIEEFDGYFKALSGWSVIDEIRKSDAETRINETTTVQPAIVAIQVALTALLKSYGLNPDGIVGHSIGEVTAVYAANAITMEQAANIIYHRARIQDKASGKGKMLAVGISAAQAEELIADVADVVQVATINSPKMVTIAGDEAPLQKLAEKLEKDGVFNRFVAVAVPYHSYHMEPLKEELVETLEAFTSKTPELPLYSTVTTHQQGAGDLNGAYWFLNVRNPVRFVETIENMLDDGYTLFVEVGPHPVLTTGIQDIIVQRDAAGQVAATMNRKSVTQNTDFFAAIATNLASGASLFPTEMKSPPVDMPRYPWDHKNYAFEGSGDREMRLTHQKYPFFKRRTQFATDSARNVWEIGLGLGTSPYLQDHCVDDAIIFPATAHMMLSLAAARDIHPHHDTHIHDLRFESALIVPDGRGERLDVRLELLNDEGSYIICSRDAKAEPSSGWSKHSYGKINALRDHFASEQISLEELKARFKVSEFIDPEAFYETITKSGLQYGKTFQCVKELWYREGCALARLELHDSLDVEAGRYPVHPSLFDAHLHIVFAAQQRESDPELVYLPHTTDRVKVHSEADKTVWAFMRLNSADPNFMNSDHWLFNEDGTLVSEVYGMVTKSIPSSKGGVDHAHHLCAEYRWQPSVIGQTGSWGELVKGDILRVVMLAGEDDELAKAVGARIVAARPEIAVVTTNSAADAAELAQLLTFDRRTFVAYFPQATIGNTSEDDFADVVSPLLDTFKALITEKAVSHLFVFTDRAVEGMAQHQEINVAQATAIGMMRILTNEHPNISGRVIDIDRAEPVAELADKLFKEFVHKRTDVIETEVRLRKGQRDARVLTFIDQPQDGQVLQERSTVYGEPIMAVLPQKGMMSEIEFRRFFPAEVGAGDVKIAVKAGALNFKDALNGMGILEKRAVAGGLSADKLGLEVAGIVTEVGGDIDDIKIGDHVMARVVNGFSGICVTGRENVARIPQGFSFAQASAVPVVYLTAYYGLVHLGRIEEGETVLIHAATGGVGISAIRIAQSLGVKVIATAGTPDKRDYLKNEFAIEHVFDSRANTFYDDVMKATNGQGVDLVLNSLTGSLLTQGLKCLAPYGRFIEIGKADIYGNSAVSLERLAENISFHVVDVDRLASQKPLLHRRLMNEISVFIEANKLAPHPITSYPISQLGDALKQMTRATHIGKLVVTMETEVDVLPSRKFRAPAYGAVLVTGGTTGLGLTLAEWLTSKGAKSLVLASRSGVKSEADQSRIQKLIEEGVTITIAKLDVGNRDAVMACVKEIVEGDGLAGIIHAAGLLDDGLIENMDMDRFMKVMRPKALGGWYLHEACVENGVNPPIFAMISSVSSVMGLKGQVNYASANYVEDSIAAHRHSLGMSGSSINLGVLGEYAGMSQKEKDTTGTLDLLESTGLTSMKKEHVLAKIEAILNEHPVHRLAADMDWEKFGLAYPNLIRDARFAEVFTIAKQRQAQAGKGTLGGLKGKLIEVLEAERRSFLCGRIAEAIAMLTGMNLETLSITESINKWTLDSIMLGQISAWLLKNTDVNYPMIKLVKGPTITEIAEEIMPQMLKDDGTATGDKSSSAKVINDGEVLLSMGAKRISDWLVRGSSTGNESRRLICFHSMGVGASLFTNYLLNPVEDTDVIAVNLPGREIRENEEFIPNVTTIVDQLVEDLKGYLDKPYIIWGHSFGGVIAFETIRRLRDLGLAGPEHFMITATIAPDMLNLWQNRDVMLRVVTEENKAEYLTALSRYVEDPEFIVRLLPVMRKDIPMLMSYKYRAGASLEMPITCWAARQDDMVYQDEVAQWSRHTTGQFKMFEVDGDHWFLNSNKKRITKELAYILDGVGARTMEEV